MIYPGTKVGRRVRLLRGNTKNFLCGDGTVLYPDCADSYLNLNLTQFHRTIITLHTAKQVHVKTAKIQILSVFELVVLYQCQLPDFIILHHCVYLLAFSWGRVGRRSNGERVGVYLPLQPHLSSRCYTGPNITLEGCGHHGQQTIQLIPNLL